MQFICRLWNVYKSLLNSQITLSTPLPPKKNSCKYATGAIFLFFYCLHYTIHINTLYIMYVLYMTNDHFPDFPQLRHNGGIWRGFVLFSWNIDCQWVFWQAPRTRQRVVAGRHRDRRTGPANVPWFLDVFIRLQVYHILLYNIH